MEATRRFNGFANYETWAVKLWLGNDEGAQCYWAEAAQEARAEAEVCWQVQNQIWEPERASIYLLAERLEDEVTQGMPELGPSLYSDLLNAALSEVDWHEVADSFFDDDRD